MSTPNILLPAPVVRRVRAFFAPVDRTNNKPTIFDAGDQGGFCLTAPPSPWIDMGWVEGFHRSSASKNSALMAGIPSSTQLQVRDSIDATVSFHFTQWTKLTVGLAAGSQSMNLVTSGSSASALLSGSSATVLQVNATDAATFCVGQMVVVDVDYSGQTGLVGSPIAGGYVRTALTDIHYVRRVSWNVARIASIHGGAITLTNALPGGAPAGDMKVQRIAGFVDREGGCFFQEWSALFAMQGEQGDWIYYYYPRLTSESSSAESLVEWEKNLSQVHLEASFRALPITDAYDGEQVLCYRSYLPAQMASI